MSLAWVLHIFIGATLSGVGLVIALVAGVDSFATLLLTAAMGFIAADFVSSRIARKLGG